MLGNLYTHANLFDLVLLGEMQNVFIHQRVYAVKVSLVLHVCKQTAHHGSQMDNVRRLVLFKQLVGVFVGTSIFSLVKLLKRGSGLEARGSGLRGS